MTYAQIDDHFDDHPKYVGYSAAEMGVLACAITFSNRHLTDGVIPKAWVKQRFGEEGGKAALCFVEDGVWFERDSRHFEIVGFLDHNLSKADVEKRRAHKSAAKAKAGRQGGKKSGESRRSNNEAKRSKGEADVSHGRSTCLASASGSTKQNEALSSPLLSSPKDPPNPLSGEPGDSLSETEPERVSGVHPIPTASLRMFGSLFADTYTRTVVDTLGEPWSLPSRQRHAIEQIVSTFCPTESKSVPERWLAEIVKAFLVVSRTNPTVWSAHGPDGLQRWLNAGRPGPNTKPGASRPDPIPPPYHGPVRSTAPVDPDPVAPPPKVSPFAKSGGT